MGVDLKVLATMSSFWYKTVSFLRKKLGSSSWNNVLTLMVSFVIAAGVIILLFISLLDGISSFFSGRNNTRVSRFLTKDLYYKEQIEKENKDYEILSQKFELANLPYNDPQGRFSIEFLTPYYSGNLVVIIKKRFSSDEDMNAMFNDINNVLRGAQNYVDIETINYVEILE